jgi:hypothetical protein
MPSATELTPDAMELRLGACEVQSGAIQSDRVSSPRERKRDSQADCNEERRFGLSASPPDARSWFRFSAMAAGNLRDGRRQPAGRSQMSTGIVRAISLGRIDVWIIAPLVI